MLIEGVAEAILEEADGDRVVQTYGAFEYFGERCLLNREPRAASIKACSALKTVMIKQQTFEDLMGKPLSELLPKYWLRETES